MYNLIKIAEATFILPKEGKMKVPGLVIISPELLEDGEIEKPLEQVRNVATLSGIVSYSIAMPDIHWGYGFPIGGVAAMDLENGVISPGGVGYDINCGVRLVLLPLAFKELNKKGLLKAIFERVPSGVGRGQRGKSLSDDEYLAIVEKGARWAIERGHGFEEDLEHMESHGCIPGGDLGVVSAHAKERGRDQLGSIGSGNHFIEIGEVEDIFESDTASLWGVEKRGAYILIHSGSRGFGHQICQDTLNEFIKKGFAKEIVDKQLVAAPINSPEGKKYFKAMAAAANFAFNNRQEILHLLRQVLSEKCAIEPRKVRLLYDVCHNIAKFEEHEVDGRKKLLLVHRKGATRAFGPGNKELASIFQKSGQPVLVPGDMGSFSYLLSGLGNPLSFASCCHGAGRAKSRIASTRDWKGKDLLGYMNSKGVEVMASSKETIAEEMPDAYKNIDLVVRATKEAKLAKIVARLKPHLVIKG